MNMKKILTLLLTLSMVLSCLVAFTISSSAVKSIDAYVGEEFTYVLSDKYSEVEEDGNVKGFALEVGEGYATGTLDVKVNPDNASKTLITVVPQTAGELKINYQFYNANKLTWVNNYISINAWATYKIGTTFTHSILDAKYSEATEAGNIKDITAQNAKVKNVVQNGDNIDVTLEATKEGIISVIFYYYDADDAEWYDYSEKAGKVLPPSEDLDLESTDTYADKKAIEQTYTFTQASEEFTDVTSVKLEWTISDLAATYKSHMTWSPVEMKWVEAKENISAADLTTTFKLTNYSSKNVSANVSFAVEDSLKDTFDSATFGNNDCVVKTPVTQAKDAYETSDFTALTETVTATLKFKPDAFANLDAISDAVAYGTYTVTISKAPILLSLSECNYRKIGFTVVENNIVINGSTWTEVIANNANNTIKIKVDSTEIVCHLCILEIRSSQFLAFMDDNDEAILLLVTSDLASPETSDYLVPTSPVTDTLYFIFST